MGGSSPDLKLSRLKGEYATPSFSCTCPLGQPSSDSWVGYPQEQTELDAFQLARPAMLLERELGSQAQPVPRHSHVSASSNHQKRKKRLTAKWWSNTKKQPTTWVMHISEPLLKPMFKCLSTAHQGGRQPPRCSSAGGKRVVAAG